LAEFIFGNALRKKARKNSWLCDLLWRIDFAVIWILATSFRALPVDSASRLGARVCRIIGSRMTRKSGIIRGNLATVYPDKSDLELNQMVADTWANAGRVLAEYPHLPAILQSQDRERLHIEILEQIETYSDPSKPAVIVTAHHCNWEVVASGMARLGMPNASLYSPPKNPYLDRMLHESRRALMCELLPRDNSARPLMRALKQGRTAGFVMDRRVETNEGKLIRFFGRDKPTTIMPARLALKFGLPMIPVRVQRLQDASFKVTFYPPVHPADPDASETDRAIDMISQAHKLFESWILEQPGDWFCSKRIWPKIFKKNKPNYRPPGLQEPEQLVTSETDASRATNNEPEAEPDAA
jgi:KDO2-lipid IV(A) lauroyltransferase